jgi:hypothetical protein
MAAYDFTKQRIIPMSGMRIEYGNAVAIAGVSGQDFTIATKLGKVLGGYAMMLKDGCMAYPTTGQVSGGQVTMTRIGFISKADGTAGTNLGVDTCNVMLFGH